MTQKLVDHDQIEGVSPRPGSPQLVIGDFVEIVGIGSPPVPGLPLDLFILPDNALTESGYIIWNSGNVGSGSGLDADLLDGRDSAFYSSYDVAIFKPGRINTSGEEIGRLDSVRNFQLDFTLSKAQSRTNPTGTRRFFVQRDGFTVSTITFSSFSAGSFSGTTATFTVGQDLTVIHDATSGVDSNQEDIAVTLYGVVI